MISIYTCGFDLVQNNFEWEPAINNFLSFCGDSDEVVIAINDSTDNSAEIVKKKYSKNKKVRVVECKFDKNSPFFVGQLKNEALQNCKNQYCLQLDLDERVNPKSREGIYNIVGSLEVSELPAVFLPVINLHSDIDQYYSIGKKWYLHRKEGSFRGAVKQGKTESGLVDMEVTDTCELIDRNGDLISAAALSPFYYGLEGIKCEEAVYIVHLGYMDLTQRKRTNDNFWKNHSKVRTGGVLKERARSLEELESIPKFKHGLDLSWV